MNSAHELRDQRADLIDELEVLVEIAKEEKRELSTDEQTRADEIDNEFKALDIKIKRADRIEERLKARAKSDDQKTDVRHKKQPQTETDKVVKRYSILKAVNARLKGTPLTGVEAEMHQEAEREASRSGLVLQGFGMPSMFFRQPQKRDLTVGTDSQGGYTVETSVGTMIEYLWPRMVIESLGADVMSGLTSNISFPREASVPQGTWEGENDANAESNPTYDTVSLSPNRVGTYVDISKQLLIQTSVPNLEARTRRNIERAIGNALDIAAINGSGTGNQPTGILNASGVGTVAIGTNGGTADWGNVVDLEVGLGNANADLGRMSYLTTSGMRGLFKTVEKAANTAQFIWDDTALAGTGLQRTPGEGQMNGYRSVVSTLVPSDLEKGTGYNLHAIIFANWQELIVGQFGGLDVVIDPYTNATTALVRIVLNSWWDIAIAHGASFNVIKDASAGEFNT